MFNNRLLRSDTELAPQGFKILLEMLVKTDWQTADEVPYVFEERNAGESKASLKQGVDYLAHLAKLSRHQWSRGRLTRLAKA